MNTLKQKYFRRLAVDEPQKPKIWVDATLVIKSGIELPTGIPRVEVALCSYALQQESVGLVVYNSKGGIYKPVEGRVQRYLEFIIDKVDLNSTTSKTKNLI